MIRDFWKVKVASKKLVVEINEIKERVEPEVWAAGMRAKSLACLNRAMRLAEDPAAVAFEDKSPASRPLRALQGQHVGFPSLEGSAHLGNVGVVVSELYPEPPRRVVRRLKERRCRVFHVVGVSATVVPALPGAIPCCRMLAPPEPGAIVLREL